MVERDGLLYHQSAHLHKMLLTDEKKQALKPYYRKLRLLQVNRKKTVDKNVFLLLKGVEKTME